MFKPTPCIRASGHSASPLSLEGGIRKASCLLMDRLGPALYLVLVGRPKELRAVVRDYT